MGGRTWEPSGDQAHLSRFFSKLCWWPVKTFVQRLAGAYGLKSHTCSRHRDASHLMNHSLGNLKLTDIMQL